MIQKKKTEDLSVSNPKIPNSEHPEFLRPNSRPYNFNNHIGVISIVASCIAMVTLEMSRHAHFTPTIPLNLILATLKKSRNDAPDNLHMSSYTLTEKPSWGCERSEAQRWGELWKVAKRASEFYTVRSEGPSWGCEGSEHLSSIIYTFIQQGPKRRSEHPIFIISTINTVRSEGPSWGCKRSEQLSYFIYSEVRRAELWKLMKIKNLIWVNLDFI